MNRSRVTGDLASHGNIFVDIANDRVGIGSTIPGEKLSLPDSAKIALGNSGDFELFHDGTYNRINSINHGLIYRAGFFHINNGANNESIFKATQDLGVELYYNNTKRLETTNAGISVTGGVTATGDLRIDQGSTVDGIVGLAYNTYFGLKHTDQTLNSEYMIISKDTHTYISASTGSNVRIRNGGNDETNELTVGNGVDALTWRSNKVFHAGSNINLPDNTKIQLGASQDFQLSHTGANSIINNLTGDLRIESDRIELNNQASNEFYLTCTANGAVDLYHNNVKKAYTENNGFYVTDTGQEAMARVISPSGYAARFDLTSDAGAANEDNYRIEVGTDQLLKIQGKPSGSYTTFVQINQSGHVLPGTDSTRDLGSNTVRWRNLYADTLYGDGSNLTGITQTAINNNADNRVITGSGTANTLEAESGLTYNGTTLQLAAADDIRIAGGSWTGEYTGGIKIQPDASNAYFQYHGSLYFRNVGGANRFNIDQGGNATFTGSVTANGGFGGSGASLTNVNATTLDSIDSGSFLRSDASDSVTNYTHKIQYYSNSAINTASSNQASLECFNGTAGNDAFMSFHVGGDVALYFGLDGGINDIAVGGWSMGAVSNRVWHAGNDGSGSGLDADTLDGISSASFLRSDAADNVGGALTFVSGSGLNLSANDIYFQARVMNNPNTTTLADGMYIGYSNGNSGITRIFGGGAATGGLDVRGSGVNDVKINGNTVWHAGNDGAGSGLDADTLDGISSASFLRSDASSTHSSTLTAQRLGFSGVGGNSGNTVTAYAYNIFQEAGAWSHPYPDLRINYHTGIVLAANGSYGGVRFQRDYNDTTELFSVGNGDNHVRVANNLIVSGTLTVGGAAVLTAADFPSQGTKITATGGNSITTHNSHKIHDFVGSGTFEITAGAGEVEVLIIAGGGSEGGGGSGCHGGGGGGGGGVVNRFVTLGIGKYYVVVGAGGVFRSNGGNSSAFGLVALGGGAGGATLSANGNAGGSGGGGSRDNNSNQGGAATQPTSDAGGLGNAGGRTGPSNTSPGGGGGAGGAGATGNSGGVGGAGKQFTQFNNNTYFGAGGNGNSSGGSAGQTQASSNGAGNTGAGGGGSPGGGTRFSGGSGRVMIRYPV